MLSDKILPLADGADFIGSALLGQLLGRKRTATLRRDSLAAHRSRVHSDQRRDRGALAERQSIMCRGALAAIDCELLHAPWLHAA
jgi:hypothetical protein